MKIQLESQHMHDLGLFGATAIRALTEDELAYLRMEAHALPLHCVEDITGTGVEQHFQACGSTHFPERGLLANLAEATQTVLNDQLLNRYQVLETPISFNDAAVQVYPPAQPGDRYAISPHLDHKECTHVIALYVLEGVASFCVCQDRNGAGAIEISSRPGDLILMRGYGCMNKPRPFHFVGPVRGGTRISFGLRQLSSKVELSYHGGY